MSVRSVRRTVLFVCTSDVNFGRWNNQPPTRLQYCCTRGAILFRQQYVKGWPNESSQDTDSCTRIERRNEVDTLERCARSVITTQSVRGCPLYAATNAGSDQIADLPAIKRHRTHCRCTRKGTYYTVLPDVALAMVRKDLHTTNVPTRAAQNTHNRQLQTRPAMPFPDEYYCRFGVMGS